MTGRGLLTEREREVLAEEDGGSYQYKTRSVVRDRIDAIAIDAEVLAEEEPDLYDALVGAVRSAGGVDMEPGGDRIDAAEPLPEDAEEPAAEPPTDPIRDAVAAIDLEGSDTEADRRREALVELLEYLREEGSATAAELKTIVGDDDPRLYADADSFWANMRRQGVIDAIDLVEKPASGGKRYYWKG